MVNLIKNLPNLTDQDNQHKFSRYVAVKEEHAELVKHEIRIIWGDFLNAEHVEKFPELPEIVWKIMKLGSKTRQEVDLKSAEELLDAVLRFSDIFWKLKNLESVRVKAPYAGAGNELILHK
jgi:nickel superoxide dismutase